LKAIVLMPTYNEAETLEKTVGELFSVVKEVELLIIDDNSPDGTGAIADRLASSDSRVSVLHRRKKSGLGDAYIAGFAQCLAKEYTHLIEMDADGSHRAADLAKLIEAAASVDLVIGSRWISGGEVANWSKLRQAISRTGNRYASWILRSKVRDMTSGFRIYSAQLLRKLPLTKMQAHGYAFQVEMTLRSELVEATTLEVPIRFVEREGGRSKMSFWIVVEAFLLCTLWGVFRPRR
jgi:glycosyltransferase involved in cell wall biosynthesis